MLFDPAEANHFSPMRIDLYCFPSKLERQPSRYQNFEAQSHSLFSRCLRLATTITGSHPRLATGGWLDLTRQAFHLLDYSPLSGRTIPICKSLLFYILYHIHISTHQQKIDNLYLPVEPKDPISRSFQFSKVKSGIRTGMITSCPTLSPLLISYSLFPTFEMIA